MNRIFIWLCSKYRNPKFKKWIKQEEQKEEILEAVDSKAQDFPDRVYAYLSTAFPLLTYLFGWVSWDALIYVFFISQKVALDLKDIPIIKYVPDKNNKQDKAEWDYQGRTWHLYSHLLSKAYGWSLEYISNLPVRDALSKIQEIYTEEQLEREFIWSTSENAYSYNKGTKKSDFRPLPKPYWMKPKPKKLPTMKMHKKLLPMGRVINLSGISDGMSEAMHSETPSK